MIIIILGHECIWKTVWEASVREGGGKERIQGVKRVKVYSAYIFMEIA
jgi:hypothetical protein